MDAIAHANHQHPDVPMEPLVPPPPVTPKFQEKSPPYSPQPPPWSPITPPSHFKSEPESVSSFNRTAFVNEQQSRLFGDRRAALLLDVYENAETLFPNTYYSHLAPQGAHILRHGRPAQTNGNPLEADFLALNLKDLNIWLEYGFGGKVILLRDRTWSTGRPATTSIDMLHEAAAIDPEMFIDVQDYGQTYSDDHPAVRQLKLSEVIDRMQDRSRAPINALNIECKEELLIPPPLVKHCRELVNATRYASSQAARVAGNLTEIGKKITETIHTHAVDIQSCIKFQINGQAGAFSSWHMDNLGVNTWVTLEPNSAYTSDSAIEDSKVAARHYEDYYSTPEDESVLKLWAIIVCATPAEDVEARAGFSKHGEDWLPNPKWIRVIALTRFDTLIMPPGTIHAPITVTDCLFRGGMVMQKRFMKDTMLHWKFCSQYPFCTNEKAPKQTRSVIDYLERVILANPKGYGFKEDFNEAVFKEDCKKISAVALSCSCKSGCTGKGCSCLMYGQRCGPGCHKMKKCSNPCGVHESDHPARTPSLPTPKDSPAAILPPAPSAPAV